MELMNGQSCTFPDRFVGKFICASALPRMFFSDKYCIAHTSQLPYGANSKMKLYVADPFHVHVFT